MAFKYGAPKLRSRVEAPGREHISVEHISVAHKGRMVMMMLITAEMSMTATVQQLP